MRVAPGEEACLGDAATGREVEEEAEETRAAAVGARGTEADAEAETGVLLARFARFRCGDVMVVGEGTAGSVVC